MGIENRTAIVTGAAKGIGKGIARVFASKGARVLIVAREAAAAEATPRALFGSRAIVPIE